jgi:hypothetical protein
MIDLTPPLFHCLSCGDNRPHTDAQLDAKGHLICIDCYLLDPPQHDIDATLNATEERLRREHWAEMSRAHNRESESVCNTCGGRSCNGGCEHGCR